MKIIKYGFSNYYSYRDKQEVSFTMPKNIGKSCSGYDLNAKESVSPVVCVMGHNGSGKTNLLKPLPFLSYLLNNTRMMEEDEDIPFSPFMNQFSRPTEVFVEYEYENLIYRYEVELTKDRILSEKFSAKETTKFRYIFKRTTKKNHVEIKLKNANNSVHTTKLKDISEKVSVMAVYLATAEESERDLMKFIYPLTKMLSTNIRQYGKVLNTGSRVLNAATRLKNDEKRFSLLKSILLQLDLGVDDIVFDELEYMDKDLEKSKSVKMPMGIHKTHDGQELKLPMTRESSGTQALFIAIEQILEVLSNGGIAVLDEVDSDLHPYMLQEILDLLDHEELNTKNAQILFTSHSPEILNVLNKYQVYFVEKEDCSSSAYRGDQVTGLRLDDNLYKKYMSGSIGGVPQI